MDDSDKVRRILRDARTIAVVGLSAQWHRPSYFAAKYLQEHGYRVIPVNPTYDAILGEKCYKSLRDIPEPVDVVDCFRKSDEIPAHRRGGHRDRREGAVDAARRAERRGARARRRRGPARSSRTAA